MQDWRELFSGTRESARDLAAMLAAQGIRAYVDDRQGPIVSSTGHRAHSSAVLIPPEEWPRAETVFLRWESQNERDVTRHTKRFHRVLLLSLLGPGTWWIIARVTGGPSPNFGSLWMAWLVSVPLAGQIEHWLHRQKSSHDPSP